MNQLTRFSTLPRSTLYRRISIGLGLLTILSVGGWLKSSHDYNALYASVHADWIMVEDIELHRSGALHASVPSTAGCLKNVVEITVPDGYIPPKVKVRTFPPSVVAPTTSKRESAFAKSRRMVDIHRSAAVSDLIACLRTKTGEDLGDDPQRWIEKYASAK